MCSPSQWLVTLLPTDPKIPEAALSRGRSSRQELQTVDPEALVVDEVPDFSTVLNGHTLETYTAAWNPTTDLLASASADTTARLWNLLDGAAADQLEGPVLKHHVQDTGPAVADVTSVDWSPNGKMLATSCCDARARIWSRDGSLLHTLDGHDAPVFTAKWNRRGDLILTSTYKTSYIWRVSDGVLQQTFPIHTDAIHDVAWRDDTSFATTSADRFIAICELGQNFPRKWLRGHSERPVAVRCSPCGRILAACAESPAIMLWAEPFDWCLDALRGHSDEVLTVEWSPTGSGSDNPNLSLTLASMSLDGMGLLWDVETWRISGRLVHGDSYPQNVAFSPNGRLLATGTNDKKVFVWCAQTGQRVRVFRGASDSVLDVCWNFTNNKVAASLQDGKVQVFDMRR